MSLLTQRLAPRIVEEDGSFRTRMLGLAAGMKDVIALGRGDPDFHTPPHIVEAAKAALDANAHHYTGPTGLPDLRQAIAQDLASLRARLPGRRDRGDGGRAGIDHAHDARHREPRRRGAHHLAALHDLRHGGAPLRRRSGPGADLRGGRLRARPRRDREADHAAHEGLRAGLAQQPHRRGHAARGDPPDRRASRSATTS